MARPRKTTQEDWVIKQIIDQELTIAQGNTQSKVTDMEFAVDMLEAERTERHYDWQSDIFLPEFAAHVLTQSSDEASQYFQTRDFVEVYLEDESPEALTKADANRELINRTLNQRHLRHYQKFMRANISKNIGGEMFAKCGWERTYRDMNVPVARLQESDNVDVYGNDLIDRNVQVPAQEEVTNIETQTIMEDDRFDYDIIDRRNIFFDNTYVYSLQDKQWVLVREEKTLNELKAEAEVEGYINLKELEEMKPQLETDTSRESHNKEEKEQKIRLKGDEPFDVLHRYGKYWAVVKDVNNEGVPIDIDIGLNEKGEPLDNAVLVECVISIVKSQSRKKIIRFIPSRFIDSSGKPYRPLIRGLCYIHPTKDGGLGDGRYARELQTAINDVFNVSMDRVMLATLPTMKGKTYAIEGNPTVYFEPGHVIEIEKPEDLEEFQIKDNIQGGIQQIAQLKQSLSNVTSIFPPDLGNVPEPASTTATAVAGAERNKSIRSYYRSLTFEHTFLNEFYWMITQMTWQFATEESAFKLMGKKATNFDPTAEFMYKPLSQTIETEYSKANQVRELTQLIGFVAPMSAVNPKAAALVNFMLARIFRLYGDEYADFADKLLDESAPVEGQMPQNVTIPMQNQAGLPQSTTEQTARGMF